MESCSFALGSAFPWGLVRPQGASWRDSLVLVFQEEN